MSEATPAAVSTATPVVVLWNPPVTSTSPLELTATPDAESGPVPPIRWLHTAVRVVSSLATNTSWPPAELSGVPPPKVRAVPVKLPATTVFPDASTAIPFGATCPAVPLNTAASIAAPVAPLNFATQRNFREVVFGPVGGGSGGKVRFAPSNLPA